MIMSRCYYCKKEKSKLNIVMIDHDILTEVCDGCLYKIEIQTKNTCHVCGEFSDCSNLETENKKVKAICYLCSLKRLYKEGDKNEK